MKKLALLLFMVLIVVAAVSCGESVVTTETEVTTSDEATTTVAITTIADTTEAEVIDPLSPVYQGMTVSYEKPALGEVKIDGFHETMGVLTTLSRVF